MSLDLASGEIVLRAATRSFSVRADQTGTLKGLLLGRRVAGPPPVPALQGVDLHIAPGETVGMIGRKGAGKTSTLRVLAGIVPLQSGEAACGGRVVSLLELAAGFSRDFTGRENIYLQGALYGFTREELEARVDRIIAFSELGEFIDIPVKTYSSGMYVRLGFSIAAHLDADVMLIDEVLAVGDEGFQSKCMRRISERIAAGATLVLVSHDAGAIERVCERVVVLDGGRVVFDGPTADGLLHYHRLMGTEHGAGALLRSEASSVVTDVELRDELDRRTTVFRTGARLTVAVRLSQPAELVLELRSGDGTLLHRTVAPAGGTNLRYDIGALPLLGGDYDFSLGGRTVRFSVPAGGAATGVVELNGHWNVAVGAPHAA